MISEKVLSFLKISNPELLSQFLHDCVDDLLGRNLGNFKNYSNDIEWSKEDYEQAKAVVQSLYKDRVLSEHNFDSTSETFGEEARKALDSCYEIRKKEIHQAVVKRELLKYPETDFVENIDWRLKWIIGSSKLASLREPLLQVDLHCVSDDNSKSVNFEMTLEQVNALISELENVKNELENCD